MGFDRLLSLSDAMISEECRGLRVAGFPSGRMWPDAEGKTRKSMLGGRLMIERRASREGAIYIHEKWLCHSM